ncbi:hypothetical protein MBM_04542 [Drepanopeziza brunnea f. sp. 'multigermtubi' MB_m1]|uniref:Uncharacterized protein n=1 Tax=Marssonina brunnea f. sp. multigermtubi (strain MB_m1) TaxID=1072389 RepID=K1WH89_MARBU|nr:uncharacterized protein MBM_04542 [Drepanopeziza brunnea f. sp. 'multigermtubi' MB_m1]EKD16965.1 hypothetical protein MBM_04542 [Drepanopeziza brunnea f. sp. 'multigermtubi' MB_m1]
MSTEDFDNLNNIIPIRSIETGIQDRNKKVSLGNFTWSLLTETTLRERDLRESEHPSEYLRDFFGDPRKEPILKGPVSTTKQNRRVTQYKGKTDLRKEVELTIETAQYLR